jgi:DNA-binding response OmpR family regulator
LRILLVEDEPAISRVLLSGLKAERFAVDLVQDGEEALVYMTEVKYDLVILDLGLPMLDGMTVLKRARKQRMLMPIMILSAQDAIETRVRGLEEGADDYVLKPFAFEEVLARVHALLRRPAVLLDKLAVADLEIDRSRHTVKRAGKPISLTQREYALLEYLMRNAGHPVSRTMIVEHVWNLGFEGLTNIVDVYINYLRSKIDGGSEQKLIHTARGFGYMLTDSGQDVTFEAAS